MVRRKMANNPKSQKKRRNSLCLTKTLAGLKSISSVMTVRYAKAKLLSTIVTSRKAVADPAFAQTAKSTVTIKSRKARYSLTSKSLFR